MINIDIFLPCHFFSSCCHPDCLNFNFCHCVHHFLDWSFCHSHCHSIIISVIAQLLLSHTSQQCLLGFTLQYSSRDSSHDVIYRIENTMPILVRIPASRVPTRIIADQSSPTRETCKDPSWVLPENASEGPQVCIRSFQQYSMGRCCHFTAPDITPVPEEVERASLTRNLKVGANVGCLYHYCHLICLNPNFLISKETQLKQSHPDTSHPKFSSLQNDWCKIQALFMPKPITSW